MTLIAWLLCLTIAGALLYVGLSACHALGPCSDPAPEELAPPRPEEVPVAGPDLLPPPIVIPLPPPEGETTGPVYRAAPVRTADRQSVRATRKTGR